VSLLKLMMEQTARDTIPIDVPETEEKTPSSVENVPHGNGTTQEAALYVATNLESWETLTLQYYARDVSIDNTCYRRLDPDYYAWLRRKMALARRAAGSGRISSSAFETLRIRFNDIHVWAMEHFGEDVLLSAAKTLDPKIYSPPVHSNRMLDIFPDKPHGRRRLVRSSSISSRKRATGHLHRRFHRRPLPWWMPSVTEPFPSDGAKPGSTRTADVFASLTARTTAWCAFWMAMCVSAKLLRSQSRLSERHRKRTV